jgi:signal transduction histidine kinase
LVLVRLDVLIEKVLELAGKEYDLNKRYDFRNIQIIKDFDPELPPVPCYETEIEQVVLNLLKNAAQAMRGNDHPREDSIILRLQREGTMARIEVEDNGPGMTEAVRRRIFEPFFTTKPVGEGTGLGLSVSYTIITHNHCGSIETASSPGRGARFIIRLPLAAPDKDDRT